MKWSYNQKTLELPLDEALVGFVYCIQNKQTGRAYIGKKLFTFASTRKVKGKKKKVRKESDWKNYNGSNKELQEDIKTLGIEHFTFDILHLCYSKGECSYLETKEQLARDVLRHPEQYYNTFVGCRIHAKHIKARPLVSA